MEPGAVFERQGAVPSCTHDGKEHRRTLPRSQRRTGTRASPPSSTRATSCRSTTMVRALHDVARHDEQGRLAARHRRRRGVGWRQLLRSRPATGPATGRRTTPSPRRPALRGQPHGGRAATSSSRAPRQGHLSRRRCAHRRDLGDPTVGGRRRPTENTDHRAVLRSRSGLAAVVRLPRRADRRDLGDATGRVDCARCF